MIKKSVLKEFWEKHPRAKAGLMMWYQITNTAKWSSLSDIRRTFSHADPVTTESGRRVVIFNIAGNKYRLITAIHYNTGIVYTLMVLTHSEYSRNQWKQKL